MNQVILHGSTDSAIAQAKHDMASFITKRDVGALWLPLISSSDMQAEYKKQGQR